MLRFKILKGFFKGLYIKLIIFFISMSFEFGGFNIIFGFFGCGKILFLDFISYWFCFIIIVKYVFDGRIMFNGMKLFMGDVRLWCVYVF